ncbi:MAG: F0F1 ATP synthase subunit A [Sphingomonadales bacterium]
MAGSPLDQFKLSNKLELSVAGFDASITNSALWMIGVVAVTSVGLMWAMRRADMVPGRSQSMAELLYEFVANMVKDNIGAGGRPFFPFIFSLFMFILIANLAGMVPYGFTVTSHLAVTMTFAIFIFLLVIAVGFARHGLHFFSLFLPPGTPVFLMPLIVVIEVISFFSRPVTLGVRLFANMTAGHILMKVFAGFIISMAAAGSFVAFLSWLPFVANVAVTALELLVAAVQAYVFALLTCVYLNDAVNLEH